jgi:uncharacterized protein YbjQ (UPF0145 family)
MALLQHRWEYPARQLFDDAQKAVDACQWRVKERDDEQLTLFFELGWKNLGALSVIEDNEASVLSLKVDSEAREKAFMDALSAVWGDSRPAVGGRIHQWRTGMPVTTSPFLPGREVVEYIGEVFGVVVRSRGALPALGAQLKSIVGGELGTMTNLLEQSRRQAVEKKVSEAEGRGADAVISMRFDADSIAEGWTEICAYGTAVKTREARGDQAR